MTGNGGAAPSGARAVVAATAALVAAWIAAAFLPGMDAWGLSVLRFAPAPTALLAGLALVAFLPPLARPVARLAGPAGDALVGRPLAVAGAAAGLALLAWVLPDRGLVVGDALLRRGSLEIEVASALVYPQALPLELLLHVHVPRFLADAGVTDAVSAARLLGALEAALLAGLASLFARALGVRGAAAAVAWTAVAWGGWLGLFTGYAKAFSELVLVVLAAAAAGVALVRHGRGALALGLAVGLGLGLHRSALALLPAVLVAVAVAARAGGRSPADRWRALGLVVAPLVGAALLVGPRIAATVGGVDVGAHFDSEDVRREGGLLASSLAPRRLLDLANLGLFLVPAALLAAAAAVAGRARGVDRGVLLVLGTLALSHVGMALLVHPAQGVFRDWDVNAPAGMAVAALAAAFLAGALELPRAATGGRGRAARAPATPPGWSVAVSAVLVVLPAIALAWLVLAADGPRSLARVEAYIEGPPARTAVEQAKTWDFLGAAFYRERRLPDAARAFAAAARTSRNPRLFIQQGKAAREAGDLDQALRAYRDAVEVAPGNVIAWLGLGEAAWARGDLETALEASRILVDLAPGDPGRMGRLAAVEQAIALRRAAADSLSRPASPR